MSDTSVVDNSTGKEKSRYTSGTIYKMIIAITFLLAFGLIMIFSASSYGTAASNFRSQLVFIVFGALAIWGLAFFPYGLYKKLTWPAYFLSLILTFLLLTPLGVNVNGATRWIQIPHIPFRIQIADIVKTLMIIFIASFISSRWREMHKWQTVIILWVLVGLQAGLLLVISTNLSSCLVVLGICYCSTFIASKNWKLHLGILLIAVVVAVVYVKVATSYLPTEEELLSNDNFRAKRILGWLYTEKYEKSAGYQVIQSLYAIGSGSFFGKGLGNGTQKLSAIPEAQNDMIFAIICEELGVAGAIMLFLLYGYLLYQMYVIVKESSNVFGSMMVIGVMVHLVCQIVINVSVATNVIPNTGVTLPFISSGGSALLMTMVECGMCIGIRRQQTRRVYQKHLNE